MQTIKKRTLSFLSLALAASFVTVMPLPAAELASPASNAVASTAATNSQASDRSAAFDAEASGRPEAAHTGRVVSSETEQAMPWRVEHFRPDDWIPFVIPPMSFLFVLGIIGLGVYGRIRQNRMLHETLRAMIDKGVPIPTELLQMQTRTRQRLPQSDLRRGLILTLGGFGLTLWLVTSNAAMWGLGTIPMLMGVAYLITWKLEKDHNGASPK